MNDHTNHWNQVFGVYIGNPDYRYVLVTLVAKVGSSFLQPGARMLVREDGLHWGAVSAGCLEEKIAGEALRCLKDNGHRLLVVDTRPHYGCSGEITLLFEVMHDHVHYLDLMHRVGATFSERILTTVFTYYHDLSLDVLTLTSNKHPESDKLLVETIRPLTHLIIVGEWDVSRCLQDIASRVGWQVSRLDSETGFFEMDKVVSASKMDDKTAFLLATHNLGRDVSYLDRLLRYTCGYIGVIGSLKRREELKRIFCDRGDFEMIEGFERVYCPAGLDIGAQTPQMIAVSIIAEISACFSGRNAEPLKIRDMPIHHNSSCHAST